MSLFVWCIQRLTSSLSYFSVFYFSNASHEPLNNRRQVWITWTFFTPLTSLSSHSSSRLQFPVPAWFLSARVASNRFPGLPCIINAYCSPRWQWQIGSKIHWLAVNVLFSHAWASHSPYSCQLEGFLSSPPLLSLFIFRPFLIFHHGWGGRQRTWPKERRKAHGRSGQ